MRRVLFSAALTLLMTNAAAAQSLFIRQGERAAEGSVGWSVGPFSNGLEMHAGASLDGRWDVGLGFNRYSVDFGGPDDTTFTEWAPFVRYFLFKEDDDATPVSLAAHGQFFRDDFDGDDKGWYILAGAQLYKQLTLTDGFALYPYVGFALAGESYTIGGAESERAIYLTRQFGIHGQIRVTDDSWVRATAEEHSFRRETYRALRAAYVVRF
jgi:hypothetical protein